MFKHHNTHVKTDDVTADIVKAGHRRLRRIAAALAVATASSASLTAVAHAAPSTTLQVGPGQSIQAALDRARPGDVVVVRPGTYAEQLALRTDGVTLRAAKVTLTPPSRPNAGACDPSNGAPFPPLPGALAPVGVCVIGTFAADGSPLDTVDNVRVEGLRVDGFGVGISAQGTSNLHLAGTATTRSAGLGTAIAFSSATDISGATSNDNGDSAFAFIGVAGGSLTLSGAARNRGEGAVALNSTGVNVLGNTFSGNCSGVSVVALGAPSGSATVAGNLLTANNNLCLRNPGVNPQFAGIGVLLAGASDVNVVGNLIRQHATNAEVDLPTGGIVSVSSESFGGSAPTRNRIAGNVLSGNSPDLFDDGTSTASTFRPNVCVTSAPAGYC